MATALIDVPRCLNVDALYVGPPREADAARRSAPGVWSDALGWSGTRAYRAQAVAECVDTLAVLRSYREPLEGETWVRPAEAERRLLAQVNAIIALGRDALRQVIELSLDSDVPDPGRVFASLLVLGCVEGRDWLEPAHNIFVAAVERNAAEAAAAIEAMSLSPTREIETIMVPLLEDERPQIRAGAIRVLAFRGALAEAEWNRAVHDRDPSIVAAALPAPLGAYHPKVCERALQPLLARRDAEPLVRAALYAGASLRLRTAHDCAVQIARMDPSWADAACCLATFGCLGDVRHVREMLAGPRVEDGVRAAAILGSIELVADLLELLERNDFPEAGSLIRHALATLTGLDFVTTVDADQARRLWVPCAGSFDPGVRYRYGRLLTLDALLQSLRTGPGSRNARQSIYAEMLARTASRVPRFSAYDFVAVQAASLHRIEQWLAASTVGSYAGDSHLI